MRVGFAHIRQLFGLNGELAGRYRARNPVSGRCAVEETPEIKILVRQDGGSLRKGPGNPAILLLIGAVEGGESIYWGIRPQLRQ